MDLNVWGNYFDGMQIVSNEFWCKNWKKWWLFWVNLPFCIYLLIFLLIFKNQIQSFLKNWIVYHNTWSFLILILHSVYIYIYIYIYMYICVYIFLGGEGFKSSPHLLNEPYIYIYMEVNNGNKSESMEKIEKLSNPLVMNLLRRIIHVKTFRFS